MNEASNLKPKVACPFNDNLKFIAPKIGKKKKKKGSLGGVA